MSRRPHTAGELPAGVPTRVGHKTYFTQLRLDPLGQEQAEEMLSALLGDRRGAACCAPTPIHPRQNRRQSVLHGRDRTDVARARMLKRRAATRLYRQSTASPYRARRARRPHRPLAGGRKSVAANPGGHWQRILLESTEASGQPARRRTTPPVRAFADREFIYEQPAFPEVEYTFKHALTQEVAYNSLLIERRKVLHERAAKAIEEVYRFRLEDHYSELAYHYSRSGNTQKAVDYLQLAGQQAVQRSATQKRSVTSLRLWNCFRPCQTPPSARNKNSRCKSPWVVR